MYKNTIHINNLRAAGYGLADFPIDVRPVHYEDTYGNSVKITGRVVSVRPDTGDVLGYHSRNYNITEHIPVIEAIRSSVERATVDATGVREAIKIANKGARMIYQLELPEHVIRTPDGDTATLTFLGVNSFDGSSPLVLSVGARQWMCDNGQIFTDNAAAMYKSRHTRGLSIDQGARIISRGVDVLEKEAELWHHWANQKVTPTVIEAAIVSLLGLSTEKDVRTTRSTGYHYIMDKYSNHYAKAMGRNYWALYNAFTDWATHAPTKGSKANVTLMRQKKVQEVLNNFPALAAA